MTADPHGLRDASGNYTERAKVAAWFYASQVDDPHHVITDEERERFLALAGDLLSTTPAQPVTRTTPTEEPDHA